MRNQEAPLPLYLGVLLHVKTRRKELEETLHALGLCVSHGRVLRLSSDLANAVCERYEENRTVCPPNLRGQVAVVDNIDHNPQQQRDISMAQVFLSFNTQVPLKKAIIWGILSNVSRRLKSASFRCLQTTPTSQVLCPKAASLL